MKSENCNEYKITVYEPVYKLYNCIEHITIDRLHQEIDIISLEQRRHIQCLTLMYRLSKKPLYIIKQAAVNTHGNAKTKFKLMSKCTRKYLRIDYCEEGLIYQNADIIGTNNGINICHTSPKSSDSSLFNEVMQSAIRFNSNKK